MYARVTTIYVQPGKIKEAVDIDRNSILPAAEEQDGFKGMRLLTDAETGKGISVTLWEAEEDLKAGEKSGYYREQLAKIADIQAGQPEMEVFEVSI